jgi:hypothetical protein
MPARSRFSLAISFRDADPDRKPLHYLRRTRSDAGARILVDSGRSAVVATVALNRHQTSLGDTEMASLRSMSSTKSVHTAWSLVFVTQRGECEPSYSSDVNIANGIVSHPNLVRFTGRVSANGLVHASVTVHDKYASGSGKLTKTDGQGTWKGRSGTARCSGYWTAQKS